MKNTIGALGLLLAAIVLFGAGCTQPKSDQILIGGNPDEHGCLPAAGYSWCEAKQKCLRGWEETCDSLQKQADVTVTYLVSKEGTTKYCDGVTMDSDGYRKTITNEETLVLPNGSETGGALVKSVLGVATTGMCQTVMRQLNYTVASSTVYIPPIEGWAGVSIAMCSCKPQVEVNLLRLPGIKHVVWQ